MKEILQKNTVFNFGITDKPNSKGGAPTYEGGALPLPIKIPKPKKMKGGDVEFQKVVDNLDEKINEIVSHPILVKIKSLKANSVRELCKRTVIYKDLNRDSFYLTKDIMDIVMDFLFVDYTTLDVFKQIYYYYQTKMDADKDSSGNEIPNNIIKQQVYTHSGIMKIINVLLNKFTYEQYYPDFVKTPDTPKQSLLEKDTEYHKEVYGKHNEIEVDMNFGEDHVKYTGSNANTVQEDSGDIEFKEVLEGGQRGGQGEDAAALAIALAIQSTTPPPADPKKSPDLTEEQTAEQDELKAILPTHRKYIYISRFMKLIEAFREINPTPENPPTDVNSLHVQKMLEMMIFNHLRSYNMVKQVLDLMINDYNTEFFEVLNYLVRLQNSKLISYLKINNYENPMRLGAELANYDHENIQTDAKFIIDYNRRYNVFVNNPNITENWRNTYFTMPPVQKDGPLKTDEVRTGLKTMALQYNDDDFAYYEKKNDTFYASEAVVDVGESKKPREFLLEDTTDGDKPVEVESVADNKDVKNEDLDNNTNEKGSNKDSDKGGSDDNYSDESFEEFEQEGGADTASQPKYSGGAPLKTLSKVDKYDKTYLFGRMNQIFLPHYSNEEVAQNMESIIDLITNKVGQKKLFTIGYGASGAGKTSSLIYLNKGALENREGIIIHLCNRLAAMGYKTAEIKTKEFFSSPKNQAFETAMGELSKDEQKRISYTQKPYADNANKNKPAAATADNLVLYTVERGPFYFKHTKNEQTQKEEFLCFKDADYVNIIGKNDSTAPPVAEEKSAVNETELSIALSAALGNVSNEYKGGDSELQFGGLDDTQKTSDLFGNVHTYRTFEEYNIDGTDMVRFPHPQFDEKEQTQDPNMLVNLGKLLIYLIDTDRLVKATTNNPNSSRSHVLLFLKLSLGDNVEKDKLAENVDIVIGDFAGVENAFDCDAVSVSNFLAIQKDVVPRTLYYKYEAGKEGIDIIHGGGGDDDEDTKKANNKFAENIYEVLNGLKSNGLYEIKQSGDKSTTTEFEVFGEKPTENGDIMDYLLTYEGQSLMKVLSGNKDYTKLQKSLEWVGRYKTKYFDDRIKKYEGNLKITENCKELKHILAFSDTSKDFSNYQLSQLKFEYQCYKNPDKITKEFKEYENNSNKISDTANKKIKETKDKQTNVQEGMIESFVKKASEIISKSNSIGFNDENIEQPDIVFDNFTKFLIKKKDNFTTLLNQLSEIKNITDMNGEVNQKIDKEAALITEYNTYYSNQGVSSGIKNKEYKLQSFLLPENGLIKVDNGSSYIIDEKVIFNDIVFNTLDETIGNIKKIEGEINTITQNKNKIKNLLIEQRDKLDKNIVNYKRENKDFQDYFNIIKDYNLIQKEVDLNDNKYNKYFINNRLTEDSFLSIVKNIKYGNDSEYQMNKPNFDLFTQEIKDTLIDEYTSKLNMLKAIYDNDIAEQERLKTEKEIQKINAQIEALNNSNEKINNFITSKKANVNTIDNFKAAQNILNVIEEKIKEIDENITTKQKIEEEIGKIQRREGNTEITKIEDYSGLKTNLDKVKALYTTKLNELVQKSADEDYISQINVQLELLKGKQKIFENLVSELNDISNTENDNDKVIEISNKLNTAKNTIDTNNINEEVDTINGVINNIQSVSNNSFKTNTNNVVKEITELYNKLKEIHQAKYDTYQIIIEDIEKNKQDGFNNFFIKQNIVYYEIILLGLQDDNYKNTGTDNYKFKQENLKNASEKNIDELIDYYNGFKIPETIIIKKETVDNLKINKDFDNQKKFIEFLYYFNNTDYTSLTNIYLNNYSITKSDITPDSIKTVNKTLINDNINRIVELLEALKTILTQKKNDIKTYMNKNNISNNILEKAVEKAITDELSKNKKQNYKLTIQKKDIILNDTIKQTTNVSKTKITTIINTNINSYLQNLLFKLFKDAPPQNGGNPPQKGGENFLERYDKNVKAIKEIKAQIELLYKYYQYGQKVCENRKKEGVFINQSLEEVRKTIQEILIFNADGSIETTPDFIEDCLKLYCSTGKDCFQMNQSADKDAKIPSELFNAIFEHYKAQYKPTTTPEATNTTETAFELKKKFYNELIVNIFCVFNITKSANNPPVVPYIDINALKRLYFNRNSIKLPDKRTTNDTKLFTEIQKVLLNIAKYPKKLKELHDSKDIQLLAKQFLTDTIRFPYPPQANATDNTKTPFSMDLTGTQYEKLFANQPTSTVPTNTKISAGIMENISGMIELVDRTNAASVIGTLEFVDIMSKFGTTNNICSVNDLELPGIENQEDKRFNQMKKVLQLHEISNYEFLNPDSVADGEPQPVDFFQLLSDHYKYEQGTNTWDKPDKKGGATANKHNKRNKTAKHRMGRRKNQTEKNM